MAITLHLYYTGVDGAARRFAGEMISSGTVEKIRREPGNRKYEYYFPMEDPETVLLIDSWEDQAAIDRHHDTPHDGHHCGAAGKIRPAYEGGAVALR